MRKLINRDMFTKKDGEYESVISPLALYLVLESRAKDSFHQPYISVLPTIKQEFVPGFLENHEIVSDELENKMGYIRKKLSKFREYCIENGIEISSSEWIHMCSLIQTRSFGDRKVPQLALNLAAKEYGLPTYDPFYTMLVPYADFANHSDKPSVKVVANEGKFIALRDLKQGQEIVFNYNEMMSEDVDYFYITYGIDRPLVAKRTKLELEL